MELNKECMEILQYMIEKDDYVQLEEIAARYKITNRGIRYKIDKIESFLVKNGFGYFDKKYKKGIRINDTLKVKEYMQKFIGEYTPYKYVYSKYERKLFMTLKLLQSNEYIKIKDFEEKLCVSKNTLLKELDEIGYELEKYDLKLVRKPRLGLIADGLEMNKRNAVIDIMAKSVSAEDVVNYVSKKSIQSKINNLQFSTLFEDIDIDFIDRLIKKAEIDLKREFSDEAYGGLITHLSIMIKRVQLDKVIYLPELDDGFVKSTVEYQVALEIIGKIEEYYNIVVPEMESCYIVIHLLGAKVVNNTFQAGDTCGENELQSLIKVMTEYVESIYNINLNNEREGLYQGLLLHLRPSLYRIKYGSRIENPLFDRIKQEQGNLFKVVEAACKYLEEFIGEELGEHETSYIVLHYAAALARYKQRIDGKTRIIIVCGSGIGASKMIASKISERFNLDIIGTYGSRNVDVELKNTCDFIISTIDIGGLNKDEYIKISPLFSENDIKKLEKYLVPVAKREQQGEELLLVNRILAKVKKHCEVRDEEQLRYEILYELKKQNEKEINKVEKNSLKDFIKRENIELKLNCKDWIDAIGKASDILIKKDSITEKYKEGIIENFEKLGPYMVIAPGICLAHVDRTDEINETCMSLVNLKYPIKFNSEFNDPVKLILTFATKDKQSHLNALLEFMSLINNSKDLDRLMTTSSKDEVREILKKYKRM
ncbi:transcription antiterminator [Clostridium gasigenes]|uniref:BglG family transcription antiterminator n=1 Tax=Clostridium gasigenes TaxID=94869 RepID=UPI0016236C2F|nr:BglG family transcription antiterminator [Clostridium gasigenes]MBB6624482.1 transcription antiterminator [Clostridium gasigenes]